MPVRHVVIVGLMGVGKTSVGRRLARRLGWPFIDSDAILAATTGETARSIAGTRSIDALHALEADALLAALAGASPSVISAAASTIENDACRAALADGSVLVAWLRAPARLLADRVTRSTHRPLVEDQSAASRVEVLERQARMRDPLFASVADVIVDVPSRAPSKTAREIEAVVRATAPAHE